MTILIASLSTGKGTWAEVNKLIDVESWDKVILITNDFGKENFKGEAHLIVINPDDPLEKLTNEIHSALKEEKLFGDVAVNFISGSGKEHMALLSSLLKVGAGIRLVYADNGLKEL